MSRTCVRCVRKRRTQARARVRQIRDAELTLELPFAPLAHMSCRARRRRRRRTAESRSPARSVDVARGSVEGGRGGGGRGGREREKADLWAKCILKDHVQGGVELLVLPGGAYGERAAAAAAAAVRRRRRMRRRSSL